jgi:hypothetical protein
MFSSENTIEVARFIFWSIPMICVFQLEKYKSKDK